nr:MAG TPA: hypothetical protein [Bacteriophage sp.]
MPLRSEVRGNEKGGTPGWERTAVWDMVVWGLFGDWKSRCTFPLNQWRMRQGVG